MLSSARQLIRPRPVDPSTAAIVCLAGFLAVILLVGAQYANLVARALPAIAFALCLSVLLVPQRSLTNLLVLATALSLPFAHFAVFIVAGQGVQWAHLLGLLLIIHFAAQFLMGKPFRVAPAAPWVLAIVFASALSALAILGESDEHVAEFWKSAVQLAFGVLLFFAVTQVRLKEKLIPVVLKSMILLSAAVALFGIYQLPARFLGWPGGVLRLTNPSLSGQMQVVFVIQYLIRAASIFSEPSYFGRYLVGMLALSLTAALHSPRLFGRPFFLYLVIAVQICALAMTSSMGAFYMLAMLLLLMFYFERGRQRRALGNALFAIAIVGAFAFTIAQDISSFPIAQYLHNRLFGICMYVITGGDTSYLVGGESIFMRIDTAKIALDVWRDHPILGVGLGSYTLTSLQYGNYNLFGFAANVLVNALAETGIIGFIALVGLSVSSLTGLWRVFRSGGGRGSDETNENLRLVARMAFYLVFVEVLYFHVMGAFYWPSLWFYLGLGGMIALMARGEKTLPEGVRQP